jgi:hypothetical protein
MLTITRRRAMYGAAAAAVTLVASLTGASEASAAQAGYDAVVCHTDTAYIYQYEDTSSQRLEALSRGWHFQVYHEDGGWRFGVRNTSGVSGYVLASQLCAA